MTPNKLHNYTINWDQATFQKKKKKTDGYRPCSQLERKVFGKSCQRNINK